MTQFSFITGTASPPPPPAPNRLALWAMILGISGLVLSLVAIGGVLGLVAVVLASVALLRTGRKGQAITGLVTGAVSLPMAFMALAFWVGFFFAASNMSTAKVRMAEADISNLKTALNVFEIDTDRFPTTNEGLEALLVKPPGLNAWRGPYIEKLPLDPWRHPYVYRFPGKKGFETFDLLSLGPDGREGTADDIDIYSR